MTGQGWTINFDYQAWAQGKEFHVGDTLGKLTLCAIYIYISYSGFFFLSFCFAMQFTTLKCYAITVYPFLIMFKTL